MAYTPSTISPHAALASRLCCECGGRFSLDKLAEQHPVPGLTMWACVSCQPEEEPEPEETCRHSWSYTGTQYGGDDESYRGEGRAYCRLCGADGDA